MADMVSFTRRAWSNTVRLLLAVLLATLVALITAVPAGDDNLNQQAPSLYRNEFKASGGVLILLWMTREEG